MAETTPLTTPSLPSLLEQLQKIKYGSIVSFGQEVARVEALQVLLEACSNRSNNRLGAHREWIISQKTGIHPLLPTEAAIVWKESGGYASLIARYTEPLFQRQEGQELIRFAPLHANKRNPPSL
jgi:hypothetical protein